MSNRFSVKILGLTVLLGVLCVGAFGVSGAKAAQALPSGGDSFEAAVELKSGSYEGGSLDSKEVGYFYVADIKPGQEIKVKGTFTAASTTSGANPILYLYDEGQKKLDGDMEAVYDKPKSITVPWLPNADKDSYKFYIKAGSDYGKLGSHSLVISVTDYYDANSQTDAGDTFEKAMTITAGEYGGYVTGTGHGTDKQDFYKIRVGKGATLTVKVTPPSEAQFGLTLLGSNKVQIKSKVASNPGEILEISSSAEETGDLFISIQNPWAAYEEAGGYTLMISTEGGEAIDTEEPGVAGPPTDGEAAKGTNWLLIGAGILGLVLAAVLGFVLLKKKGQPSQSTPSSMPDQPSP